MLTTRIATTIRSAFGLAVIDLSASASRPPLTPASAIARTATPKDGTVTPAKQRRVKAIAHDTSAGMIPTSNPR